MNLQTALATMPDSKTESSARLFEESLGDGFNLATFVDNFDVLLDSVGSAEHLKELVLQLAIRGRLAPQQPSDEPATTLLKRLGAERVSHRGTASKFDSPVEAPFPIPPTWAWTRLDKVWLAITDGDHQPPPKSVEGVAFLTIGNVSRGSLDFTSTRRVSESYFQSLDELRVPRSGDLLYTVVGSYGIPLLVNTKQPFCVQRHIAILKPLPSTDVAFMRRLMESRFIYGQARDGATGIAQPTVGLGVLRNFVVPLPPLAEQKRIVARVDQLMALIDDLEAKQSRKREVGARLTKASLEALTTAEGPEEFDTAWSRVLENWDTAFNASERVEELRALILWLALSGRLDKPGSSGAWQNTSLGALADLVTSGSRGWKEFYAPSGAIFIRSQDIKTDALDLTSPAFVALPAKAEGRRTFVQRNDLLVTITGANVGKAAHVVQDVPEAYVSQHVALIRLKEPQNAPWVHKWLVSPRNGRKALSGFSYGDKPGLNLDNIKGVAIRVPSIAEQKRIVAKVEHLMKLCDALEAKLCRSEDRASKLVEAVVQEMVA